MKISPITASLKTIQRNYSQLNINKSVSFKQDSTSKTISTGENCQHETLTKLTVRPMSSMDKLFSNGNSTTFINESNIGTAQAHKKAGFYITNSIIGHITNAQSAIVSKSTVDKIDKTNYVELNAGIRETSKVNKVFADYITACDGNTEINEATSHSIRFVSSDLSGEQPPKAQKVHTNILLVNTEVPNHIKLKNAPRVELGTVRCITSPIQSLTNELLYHTSESYSHYVPHYMSEKEGLAIINHCNIEDIECETELRAEDSTIKKAKAKLVSKLSNVEIDELHTSELREASNTVIKRLIVEGNKITLPKDETCKIESIEFKKKGEVIIPVKDKIREIPITNGRATYLFKDFSKKDITVPGNAIIEGKVCISDLHVSGDSVTIVGKNNIKNITFDNPNGKVIIKNDDNGKHTSTETFKTNGTIDRQCPAKGLEEVCGMSELKQKLYDDVINPLEHPEIYGKYNIKTINGLLLYGPPGCGKTFIAEKLAEETGRTFVKITPGDIASKYQHEPAEKLAQKFEEAKSKSPSILFIDEAESILCNRDALTQENPDYAEVVTEALMQMNNIESSNVLVILASNEPQKIDSAIKRTGRIDRKVCIDIPDIETRKELFKRQLEKIYNSGDINIDALAKKTEYYTANDIKMVLREASIPAAKSDVPVNQTHIENALKTVKPSTSARKVEEYRKKGEDW